MRIVEMLSDAASREVFVSLYGPGVLAGLAVVVMSGVLSVLVVVKKLGFVGQGVSHSAFGGIGVAAVLAAAGIVSGGAGVVQLAIVVAFCIAAAVGMGMVSRKRSGGGGAGVSEDTAIGMFLVGSMALGAVLVQVARGMSERRGQSEGVQSWESILFGSILGAGPSDAWIAWIVAAGVVGTLWWVRRPLLFWAFDEDSSRAFGVNGGIMKMTLMVLLALAVVVAMKLAGVVLATALLVLPGATALRLSDRMRSVVALSVASGVVGLLAGLALCLELDWQPGPSVVLVMTGMFIAAMVVSEARGRIARPG